MISGSLDHLIPCYIISVFIIEIYAAVYGLPSGIFVCRRLRRFLIMIEDPKFRSNIKGAKAAGLKVGVYFFSQAVNEVEAVEEASMALNLVSGYGLSYPIFLDVER